MVIHLRPILSQNALLWNLWLKHSTVYLSTHLLACSPVHSATLITIYISYLFTASPLLYLVLSPFSLNSKISRPNLLDSLAPLLFITLTGEHFDPGWILLSIFFMPVVGLLRAAAENGILRKLVALKIHCYELSVLGPHTAQKSCYSSVGSALSKTFCTKPTGLLSSLPSSFLFNGIWVLPLLKVHSLSLFLIPILYIILAIFTLNHPFSHLYLLLLLSTCTFPSNFKHA